MTDDGGVERAADRPSAAGGPSVAARPSTRRIVIVSILGVAAVLGQLAVGIFYLLLIAVSPDDPALDWLLTVIKLLFGAFYVATVVALVWAWTRWSWLVILAPVAAWVVFRVGYAIASAIVPNHLNVGP